MELTKIKLPNYIGHEKYLCQINSCLKFNKCDKIQVKGGKVDCVNYIKLTMKNKHLK